MRGRTLAQRHVPGQTAVLGKTSKSVGNRDRTIPGACNLPRPQAGGLPHKCDDLLRNPLTQRTADQDPATGVVVVIMQIFSEDGHSW